jgi:hypothetical protein
VSGVYTLRIKTDRGIAIRKLIKQWQIPQCITTNKTKCRKSYTMTQKLKVGHYGSVCRR